MYISLLSPNERDADHPLRDIHVAAADDGAGQTGRHRSLVLSGGWMLAVAALVLIALR